MRAFLTVAIRLPRLPSAWLSSPCYCCSLPLRQPGYGVLVLLLELVVLLPKALRQVAQHPDEYKLLCDSASWGAILTAMLISSLAGLVLERFVTRCETPSMLTRPGPSFPPAYSPSPHPDSAYRVLPAPCRPVAALVTQVQRHSRLGAHY